MSKLRASAIQRRREFILGLVLDANKCIKVQELYETIALCGIGITEQALAEDIQSLVTSHKLALRINDKEQLLVVPT